MNTQVAQDYPEIQLPLIHMNGNSGTVLGNEYLEALRALTAFTNAFYKIEFHARDYYPLGVESWNLARSQRQEIKKKMTEIREYLEIHAAHCFESTK